MRMLVYVTVPPEPFNTAVREGTAGKKLQKILEAIKPEAAYFTEQKGCRGAVLVVEMKDASAIPSIAEPWYLSFNANCEFRIAMTPEDLARSGLDKIAKGW
ncbi:MAG: panthothenate synthetase [Tepidisphaeraceae bacterium]|jgi:hypothetical protein